MNYIIKNLTVFDTDIPISISMMQKNSIASSTVELEEIVKKKRVNSFYQIVMIFYLTKGIVKYI